MKTKRAIFFSLFNAHIIYALHISGTAGKAQIANLQPIQNKAIRNLFNHRTRESNIKIHQINKLLIINQLFYLQSVSHLHQIMNGTIHWNTHIKLNNETHSYRTRQAHLISGSKIRTTRFGTNAVIYKAKENFNKLDENIKPLSLKLFKREVKNKLFKNIIK